MPVRSGLVVYASRYGSTREYARLMAAELGVEERPAPEVGETDLGPLRLVVLGSPIYGFTVLPEMERLLERIRGSLAGKVLAAFVVCGDTAWRPGTGEGGDRNLAKLTRLLPCAPAVAAVLGGRMNIEGLDGEDRVRIEEFYRMLGRVPAGFDRMDPGAARAFAARVREATGGR